MILDRFRLDGKVALVTGGTRGIGLAIATGLREAGARVIVSGRQRRADAGEAAPFEFLPADLTEPGGAARLVRETIAMAGRLDILVNNAGVAVHGESESFPDAKWREIMSLNVDAVFDGCRAAIEPMRRQGGGAILNIGSISGMIANIPQQQVAYNSSKAAVHMMTKSLASELATDNIRVNAIAPGYILTDMSRGGVENPDWFPVWRDMTAMRRVGEPEEVAAAALFLCSEAASYVTGEVLVVDGGYTTR